jgi:hypothetical protein
MGEHRPRRAGYRARSTWPGGVFPHCEPVWVRAGFLITLLGFLSVAGLSWPLTATTVGTPAADSLWVATGTHISRLDPTTNQISQTLDLASPSQALAVDPQDGALWALTAPTLSKFDTDGNHILELDLSTLGSGIEGARRLQLNPYDGSVWVGGSRLLWHLNRDGKSISSWSSPENIYALALDLDESLWVLTDSQLWHLAPSATPISTTPLSSFLNQPRYLALDPAGRRLAVADSHAVLQYDLSDLTQPPARFDLTSASGGSTTDGPTAATIIALGADPLAGTVWVLTPDNLLVYDRAGSLVKRLDLHTSDLAPAAQLAYDPVSGSLWVAGPQALGQFRGDGEYLDRVPLGSPADTLGVVPFKLLPRLSLLAPPEASETNNALPAIHYGLSGDCSGTACLPDPAYTNSLDLDVRLNGQSLGAPVNRSAGEATFLPRGPVPEGANSLNALATDRYHHSSVALQSEFSLNTHAPQFVNVAPSNGSSVPIPNILIEGQVSNPSATVNLQGVDTNQLQAGGAFHFPVTLQPGVNAFTLTATDRAGNVSRTTLALTYNGVNAASSASATANANARTTANTASPAGQGTASTYVVQRDAASMGDTATSPSGATNTPDLTEAANSSSVASGATASDNVTGPTPSVTLSAAFSQIPLSFELNQGQTHESVKFLTRGTGHAVFFTQDETVIVLRNPEHKFTLAPGTAASENSGPLSQIPEAPGSMHHLDSPAVVSSSDPADSVPAATVLRLKLVGAQPSPQVEGLEPLPFKSHYLIGNDPKKWITNVPHYAKIQYHDVYPGIDQVYYSKQNQLEYDWIVAPHADPTQIRQTFEGIDGVEIDTQGDLHLRVGTLTLRQHKPRLYQEVDGQQVVIDGGYVVLDAGVIGLRVGAYDPSLPLVIDPVLSYATYLGGSNADIAYAVTLDSQGNTYVTGETNSVDFPMPTGVPVYKIGKPGNVFVVKLNAAGAAVYSTYIGGSCYDLGRALTVDTTGAVYVVGWTCSSDFPVTAGVVQPTNHAASYNSYNAFALKLATDGSHLLYATYLGGSSSSGDKANNIAIDSSGNTLVTGTTHSTDFPTTSGAFQTAKGSMGTTLGNAFVAKLNATATSLLYSTYLGGNGTYTDGSGDDEGAGVALDTAGNAYVTGTARSSNFPTTAGSFQTVRGGYADAYVAKFGPTGALIYSTLLGGSQSVPQSGSVNANIGVDQGKAIALDGQGNVVIVGLTNATNFPTLNAYQSTLAGTDTTYTQGNQTSLASNAFVAKLNGAGNALIYATYLGGGTNFCCYVTYQPLDMNVANAVAVDGNGNAYVAGTTYVDGFPLYYGLGSAFQYDQRNAFAAAFDSNGKIQYSAAIGSSSAYNTDAYGVATGAIAQATVVGSTTNPNFPTTSNALQPAIGNTLGYPSAYIVRIDSTAVSLTASATTLNAGQAVTFTATVTGNTPIGGSVAFKDGSATLATVSVVSGSASFTTSALAAGVHPITASYGGDSNNNNPATSATVSVTVNPGPPTVSITAPANGSVFTAPASFNITATASSNGGYIARLDFFDGSTLLSTYTAPPNTASLSYTLALTGVVAGAHSYTVKATDSFNTATTSSPVNVTVYNPPTVSITAPANNSVATPATLAITASANSSGGYISTLALYDGATLVSTYTVPTNTASLSYTFTPSGVATGPHSYTVKVTDNHNISATSNVVNVTVYPSPTVSLTAPANGALFMAPALLALQATASSPNGSIVRVEFFQGGASLGAVTTAPYNLVWNNVSAGGYSLTVKVTDSVGATATATPVAITVAASPTVAVTNLANGATVTNDSVNVSGTVQATANSSVSVNGLLGSIAPDGSFVVDNVPLTAGANTLAVTVTAPNGQSSTQSLSVTSSGQQPFVFGATPTEGLAPLTVNFTLSNRGNVTFDHVDVYCLSTGAVSFSVPAANLASSTALGTCAYTTPGVYTAKVNVLDASQPPQILYSGTQTVQADSLASLNTMLQAVYFGMLDQLKAHNVNGALNSLTATVSGKYAPLFTAMMSDPNLSADLDLLKNIQDGRIGDGYAEFLVVRTINGTPTGFFIYLLQGEDGIWRIDGM